MATIDMGSRVTILECDLAALCTDLLDSTRQILATISEMRADIGARLDRLEASDRERELALQREVAALRRDHDVLAERTDLRRTVIQAAAVVVLAAASAIVIAAMKGCGG